MQERSDITPARLIVTDCGKRPSRECRRLLRKAFADAHLRNTGFRHVFIVESTGDPLELAANTLRKHPAGIGHVTPVLAEIDTGTGAIRDASLAIAIEQIGPDETFCFRLNKRGAHGLIEDTPTLEYNIGGAIWSALRQKHAKKPLVNLDDPDVTVVAEVLGPRTAIGIWKKAWKPTEMENAA
jgi:tRNA(Ser,Leu) C12 N-acetylase TAN1